MMENKFRPGSTIYENEAPYFALAEGNLLESEVRNIAFGANTIALNRAGSSMKRFAKHFPGLEKAYLTACLDGSMNLGEVIIYTSFKPQKNIFVLGIQSFPGKFAKKKHIERALEQALQIIRDDELLDNELAIPPIGCGDGGLTWKEVEPSVRRLAEKYKVKVIAYIA